MEVGVARSSAFLVGSLYSAAVISRWINIVVEFVLITRKRV